MRVRTLGAGDGRRGAAPRPGRGGASCPAPPLVYRFDPTRPESRTARLVVDDALQRAAGRADVDRQRATTNVVAPGSRYIDWLIPGLLGMNIMGTGLWSVGFSVVVARTRKLLKRLMATPMPRAHYLLSHLLSRLGFLVLEVGGPADLRPASRSASSSGRLALRWSPGWCCSARSRSPASAC